MLESLRVDAVLDDGRLEVEPIVLAWPADMRRDPSFSMGAARRRLRLQRSRCAKPGWNVVPALSANASQRWSDWRSDQVSGHGNSIAANSRNASGSFDAKIDACRISNLADAKLGLNFGKAISAWIRGEREIAIECGAIAFDFRDGVGKSRTIVLDTSRPYRRTGDGERAQRGAGPAAHA